MFDWTDDEDKLFYKNNIERIAKKLGVIDGAKEYIDKNIDSVNVFEKVYILLKLHRYELAYNILKKISFKAKENGNNFIFIIFEFNSKVITGTSNTSIKYIQKGNKFKQQNKN